MAEVGSLQAATNPSNLVVNVPAFSAYNDEYFSKIVGISGTKNVEEFYQKLVEMRNEQKKSLQFMEELYNQKQSLKKDLLKTDVEQPRSVSGATSIPTNLADYKFNLNSMSAYESPINLNYKIESVIDEPKTLTKLNLAVHDEHHLAYKPPLPNRPGSTVTFQETVTVNNISPHDDIRRPYQEDNSLESDLKRIEQIWNDFKFEDAKSIDFNRKFEKRVVKKKPTTVAKSSSSSVKRRPASAGAMSASIEWVPRITIPEPFSMTIRDRIKQEKKLKMSRETQEDRDKRADAEVRECNIQFKAQPVPTHVMLPVYQKLKMEEELRKIKLKQMSKEYLEKVSKPFNLSYQKKNNANSSTTSSKNTSVRERRHSFTDSKETMKDFRAQPLPDFYYNEDLLTEKMKEDELYKQIKNRMRAAELMSQSRMPSNMALIEEKKRLEQLRDEELLKELAIQQQLNSSANRRNSAMNRSHDVPDFDSLYRRFVIDLERKKAQNRKNTKQQPFNLLTDERFKKDEEDREQEDLKNTTNTTDPFIRSYKTLATSMDALPIKLTESQKLRESYTKEKLNDIARKELQREHIEKMKKLRNQKRQEELIKKVNYNPKELSKNIERETRKKRLDLRAKEEEYERELEEMEKRLETRKFHFEQVEENNLKRQLEKKYQDTLKRAGLNEYEIQHSTQKYRLAKSVKLNEVESHDDWINN